MPENKKVINTKSKLHPNNKHRQRYNFEELVLALPELKDSLIINKYGDESIDFSNPISVSLLNKALLYKYYNIRYYEIPNGYLSPPIPGRADYIHYIADLLANDNLGAIPKGDNVKCFDIGMGANCIYPIIGNQEYGWSFVGSDIDKKAIEVAQNIIDENPSLGEMIELRFQENPRDKFRGVIKKNEVFDVCICNPPFNESKEEADRNSLRKIRNLKGKEVKKTILNFGGKSNELWCYGGEKIFIKDMIFESRKYAKSFKWFTTLLSKKSNLYFIEKILKEVSPKEVRIIPIGQGNKISRIIAWRF